MSRRVLALVLLVASNGVTACTGTLPPPETFPDTTPYIVAGAASDATLQLARAPWWVRLVGMPLAGGVVRYSTCCRRPEAAHFAMLWGAGVAEVVGLFVRGKP